MSDELIAPGKRLARPLMHPTNGNILLPLGTVLTGAYIDRLNRQGLLPMLKVCMEGFDEALHGPTEGGRRDLDSFDIDVPELPAILFEYTAAVNVTAPASAAASSPTGSPDAPPPAAAGPTGGASGGPVAWPPPPVPGAPAPVAPTAPPLPPQPTGPLLRYFHNPTHVLTERNVMTAMLAADSADQQLRGGHLPAYPPLGAVVQEVIARLGASQDRLGDGLELRIVNQPHHKSHPVNVMTLSIAIGLALGLDARQLVTLGISALCHDIGKAAIPLDVLEKSGALTPQEIELLRAHPVMGRRIMAQLPWATPEMARIVHEHHERLNGAGYPQRLQGDQIHVMARIVAVAEVYDALASDTGYRPRYTPEFSYVTVRNGERLGLDPLVIKAFARHVYPYPLQAFLKLADGRVAQVVQNNRLDPLRPIIRVDQQTLNLMDVPNVAIKDLHIQAF
ncbi:MAG: HD domain-containing phosphohydrolase [Candidatus Sericytochromatia bacterium]|nr:HD domain-containing phosphohydrolase [Candidatus Sericytochromatia bacterium]